MKKLLLLTLVLVVFSPLFARKVVFRVDMTGKTISTNGVHLAGNFQNTDYSGANDNDLLVNWSPSAYLMTNGGSGNIYSVTLEMKANLVYEYKIINDNNWTDVEVVPTASQVGGGNNNRWVYIPAGTDTFNLPAILFGGTAPIGKSLLSVSVDMTTETSIDTSGVHVMGSFQGWSPSASRLVNYSGNGSYNASKYAGLFYVDNNTSVEFKFVNGSTLSKSENLPVNCVSANGNRYVNNINGTTFYDAIFGKCISTGATSTRKVLFRVDMTGKTISANGVHIAGNFQNTDYSGANENATLLNWDPAAYPLTYTGVGNIYSYCMELKTDLVYEYKFINDNNWTDVEFVPIVCQVGNNNDNRWVYIPSGSDTLVLPALKFAGLSGNGKSLLLLSVDMSQQASINAEGVYASGNFQGSSSNTIKLVNYLGSGAFGGSKYKNLIYVDSNGTAQFKFMNGILATQFENVSSNCLVNSNRQIKNILGSVSKEYIFGQCTEYTIESSAGTNGSIYPSGVYTFAPGTSTTYSFTPINGYWIDSVIVNGVKIQATSAYTFSNLSSNQSIRVTYRSLAAALAAANICVNDTTVATVNLPAASNVRATAYFSNIYLFNQNNTGNAYKYNVNDRKYTAIADKPSPCNECGVAEANGKIYCFNTNGTTQAYDIASNTWQSQTAQPNSSTSSVYAVSVNNKIYVLGTNANNQNIFVQYNPQNNTYTAQASPIQATSQSKLVAFNNLIYKIGGITLSNNTTSTAVEVYNPSNNTWTSLPDLPEPLSNIGATSYNNKLYVFGGKQSTIWNSNSNKVYVFDFTSNAWYAQINSLNFNRANIEAKTSNNMVFLLGGTDTSNTSTNQAMRYFCKDQLCNCKWAEYVCNGISQNEPCPTSSSYKPGTVFCNNYATKIVEVINPVTGRTWMDRNLGAIQAANSNTDTSAYGDLYQWGRKADGHQCRNSGKTSNLSSTDQPTHAYFILSPNAPGDWRTTQNNNLWQGVNGINNPCPEGYRLPTFTELEAERTSWSQNNALGAFGSPLKLPKAGYRDITDGNFYHTGIYGNYYTSSVNGQFAGHLYFGSSVAGTVYDHRAAGFSVRCIKDLPISIGSIDTIINLGTLTSTIAASNVSTILNYSLGNGVEYEAQTIASTGIAGLTATLTAGTLNKGNGSITLNITGTPAASGIAGFSFTFAGKVCIFYRIVLANSSFPTNAVQCTTKPSLIVDVTNPITGKTWMDRNLGAMQVASNPYDSAAFGDLYQWGRGADGHQCRNSITTSTLSSSNQPAHANFITSPNSPNDWLSPQNDNLWQGVNGTNNPCPSDYRLPSYIELEAERTSWTQNNGIGALGSPLKLSMGGYRERNIGLLSSIGNYGVYQTNTVNGTNSWYLIFSSVNAVMANDNRAYGFSVRCIKNYQPSIGSFDTTGSTNLGTLTESIAASNVSTTFAYTNGNGAVYNQQNIASTGVTGLTATLAAGTLNNGNGTFTFNITGTPTTSGTASFIFTLGGKTCTFTRSVLAYTTCLVKTTAVVEVTNPITGKTWMDRNLGATRAATSSTDSLAYGDLYQWGRGSDGHQCRNSITTTNLSSNDQPAHANFIITTYSPYDWRSPQNDNLWQGVNGINNPCPTGFRLPTTSEQEAEKVSWSQTNSLGAFGSPLKLPTAGYFDFVNSSLVNVGSSGIYWSSTVNSVYANYLYIYNGNAYTNYYCNRGYGISVRCIKDYQASIGSIDTTGSTNIGTITENVAVSNVSTTFAYTNGNGAAYNQQSIASTGVTGLTATLTAGTLNNGNGTFTFNITGTPTTSGIASFTFTLGGKTGTFTRSVLAISSCLVTTTAVVEVTNPITGRTWMDRNLGATRAATSSSDTLAYGDYYQWGRGTDGHQCRYSTTSSNLSSVDQPNNSSFILSYQNYPYDWRDPQNDNLWQGVNGINNPCPTGYRLPTLTELTEEKASWSQSNNIGAMGSVLKLPMAGDRGGIGNYPTSKGTTGTYWSATVNSVGAGYLRFNSSIAITNNFSNRVNGYSVRCIKDYQASIGSFDTSGSTNLGTLTESVAASNVSTTFAYTNGNGAAYNQQSIASTGVSGLTATLAAGTLNNGNGTFTFNITGTPTTSGTASFTFTLGGNTCTFTRNVLAVTTTPNNAVYCNGIATVIVDVTNPVTGKTWMDRNLGATRSATSSVDSMAFGDLYQWGRGSDGHQCRNSATTITLSSSDQPGHANFILTLSNPIDWRTPQNNNLWQGVNGVNNPCPSGYRLPNLSELEAEKNSWSQQNSIGAIGSPLKLPMTPYRDGFVGTIYSGGYGQYWSNSISGTYARYLGFTNYNSSLSYGNRTFGYTVRCIKETVPPEIGSIDTTGSSNLGSLTVGVAATNVSTSISYSNGNGSIYGTQNITSSNVSGLTATLIAGSLNTGNGTITFNITGTPTTAGTASFTFTFGGKTCTFTRNVLPITNTVYCNGTTTAIVDVINPITGRTWMDRNLGASQAASSVTDSLAYGDLYQWGRSADGHQCRNSATTNILSTTTQPNHANFILHTFNNNVNSDWLTTQNNNLWQGVNSTNNPCPTGYRLPKNSELEIEKNSWKLNNNNGTFGSPLKLPLAGGRNIYDGSLNFVGNKGMYWSSTVNDFQSMFLLFDNIDSTMYLGERLKGISVRCIKDNLTPTGNLDTTNIGHSGILNPGIEANNVTTIVSYTNDEGVSYEMQNASSTGVTGLTATLNAGSLVIGNGALIIDITGTPTTTGIASFSFTLGGKSFTFTRSISAALNSNIPIYCKGTATTVIDVTNPITGKTWMDRNIGATRAAISSTDSLSYGDLYQWGRRSDGHQCRNSANTFSLSSIDQPGYSNFILSNNFPNDWRSFQNDNLWQGVNGVNNPCPSGYRLPSYSELEEERTSWVQKNSSGAFGSPLKLPLAGYRMYNDGALYNMESDGHYWSSTLKNSSVWFLYFDMSFGDMGDSYKSIGYSVRCIKNYLPMIGSIDTTISTIDSSLKAGEEASFQTTIDYTNGNGAMYDTQNLSSTGVTGLTATLEAGTLSDSNGTFTFYISGTPSSPGSANFTFTLGNKSYTFTKLVMAGTNNSSNSNLCPNNPTAIVNVTNPTTGKTWMDRNLGASQAATSSIDSLAFGDLYQWGRGSDGHQCRNSGTTNTLSTTYQPNHTNFILASTGAFDWLNPNNDNLWQGVNGINNPCPTGYRIPTITELDAEQASWTQQNSSGAFSSPLKLPMAGRRYYFGSIFNVGSNGSYWSSSVYNLYAYPLTFSNSSLNMYHTSRAYGFSVRCIKN